MAELQILNSKDQWKTFEVKGPRFLIGRRENCHMVLKDGWISREHTLIMETTPGEFTVKDLQSENGTFVNGTRITESPLNDQDRLRVGRTEMLFLNRKGSSTPRTPSRQIREPESRPKSGESTHFLTISEDMGDESEQTLAGTPAPNDRARADLRDRLRRFEKLLQVKEEEISRLAAENAVVKRALAQGGLLDRTTGQPDFQRLATPSPTLLGHPAVVRQTWNPLARVVFPRVSGGFVAPEFREGKRDTAIGLLRLNSIGLGDRGANVAEAFHRVGHRHAIAIGTTTGFPDLASLPGDAGLRLEVPEEAPGAEPGKTAIRAAQQELSTLFQSNLWPDADLQVVICGLEDALGAATLGTFLDVFEESEKRSDTQSEREPAPKSVVVLIPSAGRLEQPGARERLEQGLAELRVLSHAGRLGTLLLVEEDRLAQLAAGPPSAPRTLPHDLVAGAFDALNRLSYMDPVAGDLEEAAARKLLLDNDICTVGLAATIETEESALRKTVEYAVQDGVLAAVNPASRSREAGLLVLIGKTVLGTESRILDRVNRAVEEAKGVLPQANISTGVFLDDGEGVRVLACLGGLPFPEKLGA
jgi:pSer/pThr/pTyr-binding forkhead associated (FHA) protein